VLISLIRNPEKRSHMVEFMSKLLDKGHAEVARDFTENEEFRTFSGI
jgi:hypothetical protein